MSNTKNNHYLSQCISKNFAKGYNPPTFWEYNPHTKETKPKNITKLFAKRRAWGQDLETAISKNFETKLAPVLREYAECEIQRLRIFGPNGITEPQFNGMVITNGEHRTLLSKLCYQTILLQRINSNPDDEIEQLLVDFYSIDNNPLKDFVLSLHEIHPLKHQIPLILTDGMLFICPVPQNSKKHPYHIIFMFPICEYRFLLWSSCKTDVEYFCHAYQDIHRLNLCRIDQHNKECRIASPNRAYLDFLIPQITSFSNRRGIKITASRSDAT